MQYAGPSSSAVKITDNTQLTLDKEAQLEYVSERVFK